MLENLIRIDDPDVPIFRTFRFHYFRDVLRLQELALVSPSLWDDPFENFLLGCAINYMVEGKWQQVFFDRVRKHVYAQCWSMAAESDALWRIYSTVDKNPQTLRTRTVDQEGVKVRTTPRKLLQALWTGSPSQPESTCFLGLVQYMSQQAAAQRAADEALKSGLNAFAGGVGHAEAMLIKREPFQHEQEVRLVFVDDRRGFGTIPVMSIRIDPNSLFDEMVLDPRLHPDDVRERTDELRSLGFIGPVRQSDLYRRVLYEIVIPPELTASLKASE